MFNDLVEKLKDGVEADAENTGLLLSVLVVKKIKILLGIFNS